ncbi:hypothetical protein KKB18_02015 [bacterium]|nr:hypothetical protein [bacterium]
MRSLFKQSDLGVFYFLFLLLLPLDIIADLSLVQPDCAYTIAACDHKCSLPIPA